MADLNIVGPKFDPEHDMGLFLSVEEEQTGVIPDLVTLEESDKTMAHLLSRLGKFSSVGEAKRNGWDKPIPTGWNHTVVGKAKNRLDLWIWNPTTTMEEWI